MAKVLLFGPLSDVLQTESLTIQVPADTRTVDDLIVLLHDRGRDWQKYLNIDKLQVTVNRQFGSGQSPVTDNDEIAFISRPGSV